MKLAVSAGELSADEHTASIVAELRALDPSIEVRGMGGRNLRAQGVETVVDCESSGSVMGFGDVLAKLGTVLGALSHMKRLLREWRPDALLIVDYAEFNMLLGRRAHKLGIPVFYYITPQVWAWRQGRVKTLRRILSGAATLFPFEADFLRRHGVHNAHFVGHPFSDKFRDARIDPAVRREVLESSGLNPRHPVVALFPGSRSGEVRRHLADMIAGFELFRSKYPDAQAAVAIAPTVARMPEFAGIEQNPGVHVFKGTSIQLLQSANAGILKSGTSNLQAVYCDLPFTMFYKATKTSEWIVKTLVALSQYSIVNVLRPDTVRELIQEEASPKNVADEIEALLGDNSRRSELLGSYTEIRQMLEFGEADAAMRQLPTVPARVAHLVMATMKRAR